MHVLCWSCEGVCALHLNLFFVNLHGLVLFAMDPWKKWLVYVLKTSCCIIQIDILGAGSFGAVYKVRNGSNITMMFFLLLKSRFNDMIHLCTCHAGCTSWRNTSSCQSFEGQYPGMSSSWVGPHVLHPITELVVFWAMLHCTVVMKFKTSPKFVSNILY